MTRIWSIHPKYLDNKGLGAQWREGLHGLRLLIALDYKNPYYHHSALNRFREGDGYQALANILWETYHEATRRGLTYQPELIPIPHQLTTLVPLNYGQLYMEWNLLRYKLFLRDIPALERIADINNPETCPGVFSPYHLMTIEAWEKTPLRSEIPTDVWEDYYHYEEEGYRI